MDLWQKARNFAEEAAKRSQEITKEAAKRSQFLTKGAAEIVSETAKKSKEFAFEATKKADQIKIEALKRADQIKTIAEGISPQIPVPSISIKDSSAVTDGPHSLDLERFGVTDELREFVKGITISTFQDFPFDDEPQVSDVRTVSNVRQDLTEWQARHATLVLSAVKEISRLRYELCPRHMKERKFWRIYFMLVKSHVAPYEKRYMEELKQKSVEQGKDTKANENPTTTSSVIEMTETKRPSKASSSEQDLDVFLLGDLGSSDEGPDDGDGVDDGDFDDDFDKIVSNSAQESEDDDETSTKQSKSTTTAIV